MHNDLLWTIVRFFFSAALHLLVFAGIFYASSGPRKVEGYPTVIPVELLDIKPVAFKAPEVQEVAPRRQVAKPQPKKLEGVTVEKPKPVEDEPEEQPVKQIEKPEKSDKGKSSASNDKLKLDVPEFPFSYYLALLRGRIQSNWEPPFNASRTAASRKAVVAFRIRRNGQLTKISIVSRSGDYLFDQACLRAVTLANPLPPLPFDFPRPSLGVQFEFEQGR